MVGCVDEGDHARNTRASYPFTERLGIHSTSLWANGTTRGEPRCRRRFSEEAKWHSKKGKDARLATQIELFTNNVLIQSGISEVSIQLNYAPPRPSLIKPIPLGEERGGALIKLAWDRG